MNCGGKMPDNHIELMNLFDIPEANQGFTPDLYIIGLQEIVKLNAKNIMIKDKKKVGQWRALL